MAHLWLDFLVVQAKLDDVAESIAPSISKFAGDNLWPATTFCAPDDDGVFGFRLPPARLGISSGVIWRAVARSAGVAGLHVMPPSGTTRRLAQDRVPIRHFPAGRPDQGAPASRNFLDWRKARAT